LKRRMAVVSAIGVLLVALFALSAFATPATLYFATDKNGTNKVTQVAEGTQVWIVVNDPDDNIDCGLRDKIWVDLKVFDPKTGAYIVWDTGGYYGINLTDPAALGYDYLEETSAASGIFVSHRAFQIGTREDYNNARLNTHIVGPYDVNGDGSVTPLDFQWGHYEYGPDVNGPDSDGPTPGDWTNGTNVHGDTRGWYGPRENRPTTIAWPFVNGLMDGGVAEGFFSNVAYLPSTAHTMTEDDSYLLGRFENLDTLIGMFQGPRDERNIATAMLKITSTPSTVAWDTAFHTSPRTAATLTITDQDENLDCNKVEYVPVFIIVNPGSWNPLTLVQSPSLLFSPNEICSLIRFGGVVPSGNAAFNQTDKADGRDLPIRWYNIYDSGIDVPTDHFPANSQPQDDGAYYMQYPVARSTDWKGNANVVTFDTADPNGYCRVMFWAQETGTNTGVFQLNLNSILTDLGFTMLNVGDVIVAYYLDPNDFSDFQVASMYIGTAQDAANYSATSFTDVNQARKHTFAIGQDPVYIQVIDQNANQQACCPEQVLVHICDPHEEDDSEWVILDEQGNNSPMFFTNAGTELLPVWDALGVGLAPSWGGYQLQLDNWKLEVFNGDSVYAQYNDVTYDSSEYAGLGDVDITTSFPPYIQRARVANDLSYDLMKVTQNEVFNGTNAPTMYFLDADRNRIDSYINSQSVYIEVVDSDQNENSGMRERIDAYWDGGQNIPFGPEALNHFICTGTYCIEHAVNPLLGDTNVFNDSPINSQEGYGWDTCQSPSTAVYDYSDGNTEQEHGAGWAKVYVLNPRNGRWAATDLLEKTSASGDFVSVICIPLVSQYPCVPSLDVQPGDTVVAFYQDPSDHHDACMISLKVQMGGGGSGAQKSTVTFATADGTPATTYYETDSAYVKVIDTSHVGAASLPGAVTIGTTAYDLSPLAGVSGGFITRALTMTELGKHAGDTITATYTDPTDPTDTNQATAAVVASSLVVNGVHLKDNPLKTSTSFVFDGSGVPTDFTVTVYAPGTMEQLWTGTVLGKTELPWDGTTSDHRTLASGPYVFVAVLKGTSNGQAVTITKTGTLIIDRL